MVEIEVEIGSRDQISVGYLFPIQCLHKSRVKSKKY